MKRVSISLVILLVAFSSLALAQDEVIGDEKKPARHSGHRMPDGGPIYVETIKYMNSHDKGLVWEPFNTASATLFGIIAIYWLFKIRGKENALFFRVSMWILLIGSVGGTLYHGLRSSRWFLMMDVMPIMILFIASVVWIIKRLTGRTWQAVGIAIGGFILTMALYAGFRFLGIVQFAPSMGYLTIAFYVAIPYTVYVNRTRKKDVGYLLAAFAMFLIAFASRSLDFIVDLPMGTHFLWHSFGAFATATLTNYLWRTRNVIPAKRKAQTAAAEA